MYIQTTLDDPSVLLPPDVLTETDGRFDNGFGWNFMLGWNYPAYNGDVTAIEIYRDGVRKVTLTNTVGGSKKTGRRMTGLSANTEYSFTIRFGDSEGNFSEMSDEILVTLP